MVLKPQDVFVVLKLVAKASPHWTYVQLANELFMSVAEINAGVRRAIQAGLVAPAESKKQSPRPVRKALEEFLVHGLKYAYPPDRGELTRGMPTAYAAPPLESRLSPSSEPPPVWPDPEGRVRGYSFSPLYKSVPKAAVVDRKLYELLALVDAIRDGRARDKDLATKELYARLAEFKESYKGKMQ
jgi:hypothetical protein